MSRAFLADGDEARVVKGAFQAVAGVVDLPADSCAVPAYRDSWVPLFAFAPAITEDTFFQTGNRVWIKK